MRPKLTLIDSQAEVDALTSYLIDKEFVAYDVETTGVHKGAEIIGLSVCADEAEAFYVILAYWDVPTSALVYLGLDVSSLLAALGGKRLILHNAVFDCAKTFENFKVELISQVHTDTMLLAHVINENRQIGLKPLAREYFGDDSTREAEEMKASVIANGGVWQVKNKEMYKCDSKILGKYGAKDAWLTLKLFFEMLPELEEQGLYDFFYADEVMPQLREVTYELNTVGLRVDQSKLIELQKTLEAENAEHKAFIYKEIQPLVKDRYPGSSKKNTFNIGSSQQLSWLLFKQLGLEFNTLTKAGKTASTALGIKKVYTKTAKTQFLDMCEMQKGALLNGVKIKDGWAYTQCDNKTLLKLQHRYKWIERLIKYQKNNKLLSTYVEGIQERLQYGTIYPSFLQSGTTSGRYSSRQPNFQNLPRDDKRVKGTITARPGKVFVGADYSQLEPRVFAYFSGDRTLISSFDGKTDFYSPIGIEIFEKYDATPAKSGPDSFKVKYPELRELAKKVPLSLTYGTTVYKLAGLLDCSIDEAQNISDKYFERFPGVKAYMEKYHAMAKETGEVATLFGRKRRIPQAKNIAKIYGKAAHAELPYEARNLLNLAVNHPIQGTGANIVNRACIAFKRLCREAGLEAKIVLQVHDSIIAECADEDADSVACLLREAMEHTVSLGEIALEAIPKIGKTLADV